MSRYFTAIEIDGEKLRKEFEIRKLSMMDVSENCGFEKSYFSKAVRSNRISKPAMNLLSAKYNIGIDSYKLDAEIELTVEKAENTAQNVELVLTDEMSDKLYQLIYTAVYQAVKKAWSE